MHHETMVGMDGIPRGLAVPAWQCVDQVVVGRIVVGVVQVPRRSLGSAVKNCTSDFQFIKAQFSPAVRLDNYR